MHTALIVAVLFGLLLELAATVIYIWGEFTNPEMKIHPLAWFGLASIMTVGSSATSSLGAAWGIYVLWAMTGGTWLVFLIALYFRAFKKHRVYAPEGQDWALFVVGLALLVLRASVLSPLPAAIAASIGDSCFIALLLKKLWKEPDSEGWHGKWCFTLTTIATVLAALTLDSYSVSTVIYPLYVVVSTGLLAAACWGWTPGQNQYFRFEAWREGRIKARVSRA